MKTLFFALALLSSLSAQADPNQYVCKMASIDSTSDKENAQSVQTALNSLNCNPAQPITSVKTEGSDTGAAVILCCVAK